MGIYQNLNKLKLFGLCRILSCSTVSLTVVDINFTMLTPDYQVTGLAAC